MAEQMVGNWAAPRVVCLVVYWADSTAVYWADLKAAWWDASLVAN